MPKTFLRTLEALESSLTVSHIAVFPVVTCTPSEETQEVERLMNPKGPDFSHVPVRAGGRIARVHIRCPNAKPRVLRATTKAYEQCLVDSSMPLLEAVPRLKKQRFLLVRSAESGLEDRVSGIVNHDDLNKLPVRLLLFARLSEIEVQLRKRIGDRYLDSNHRAVKRAKKRDACKKHNLPATYAMNLRDLAEFAQHLGSPGVPPIALMEKLRDVRNKVAHSDDNPDLNPTRSVDWVAEAFEDASKALTVLGRTSRRTARR